MGLILEGAYLSAALAILCGTEPVSAKARVLYIAALPNFIFWMLSVANGHLTPTGF